jgi:hypothetical protein
VEGAPEVDANAVDPCVAGALEADDPAGPAEPAGDALDPADAAPVAGAPDDPLVALDDVADAPEWLAAESQPAAASTIPATTATERNRAIRRKSVI